MDQNLVALDLSNIGKKDTIKVFKKAVLFRQGSNIQLKEIAYKFGTHSGNMTKIEKSVPNMNTISKYLSCLLNLSGLTLSDFL